jgi:glycosyltransferase involved in cell wall biosynthesis
MEESPLISILVPIYNEAPYLKRCLESILEQEYPHFEILLSDNASSDASWSIAQEFARQDSRLRIHRFETQVHAYDNLLKCADMSSGHLSYHMGGDDYLKGPGFLQTVAKHFSDDPKLGAFISRLEYFEDQTGTFIHMYPPKELAEALAFGPLEFLKKYSLYCGHDELLVAIYKTSDLRAALKDNVHWGVESAGWWICLRLFFQLKTRGEHLYFDYAEKAVLMKRVHLRTTGEKLTSAAANVHERDTARQRLMNSVTYAWQATRILDKRGVRAKALLLLIFGLRRKTPGTPWFPAVGWGYAMGGWIWPRGYLLMRDRSVPGILKEALRRLIARTSRSRIGSG